MKRDAAEILKEALAPAEARAALAKSLLDRLDTDVDEDAGAAWATEVNRRVAELNSGAVKAIPWAEQRRRLAAGGCPFTRLSLPVVFIISLVAMLLFPSPSFAQWTKTIDCPEGTVYRDVRRDAGREEFCERQLPSPIKVQHGPSRWWYSEGHFGEEGNYTNGRKAGKWKECDRFDRCQDRVYELLSPEERARGLRPEVPITFANGKYVFDFGSCWSTRVTRQTPDSFVELNVVSGLIRCQVTYISSTEKDRAAGNQGHYLCEVPYSVGVRSFDSVDLRSELPRAGLPQFCRKDDRPATEPMPDGLSAQALAIWVNQSFLDGRTKQQARAWTTLADVVDVECAAIDQPRQGAVVLTVRLNEYAEKLVMNRLGKDEIKADACGGRFPLTWLETTRDASGHTLFNFALSRVRTRAPRQRACIASQVPLQPTCASR